MVAAELLAVGAGEDDRQHRLPHHAGRGDGAGVGALAQRLGRLARGDVDGAQRLGERRERLHRAAHDERLARAHAALDATGAVRLAVVAALVVVEDLVVGGGARAPGEVEAVADPAALDRLDGEHREPDAAVEARLPAHVGAEARHEPEGADLEDAAERLVALAQDVDLLDHRPRGVGVQAADGRRVDRGEVGRADPVGLGGLHRADLRDVGDDVDVEGGEERLGQRAAGHAGGRLAGARALEDVADVREAVLLGAGEVRVAGTREVDLRHVGLHGPRVHPLLPVGVVAVGDHHRDRAADRAAVAHAARDLRGVLLDLHPPAPAVAELAAGHVGVDGLEVELEAGGQPLDHAGQAGAVGFTCGDDAEHAVRVLSGRA